MKTIINIIVLGISLLVSFIFLDNLTIAANVILSSLMFGILATATIIFSFLLGLKKGYDLIIEKEEKKSYLSSATLPIIYSFIGLLVFLLLSSLNDLFATNSAISMYNFFTLTFENYSQVLESQVLAILKIQLGLMHIFSSIVLTLLAFIPFIIFVYSYLITLKLPLNTGTKKGGNKIKNWIINTVITFSIASIFFVYFNSISTQVFLKKPIQHEKYGKIKQTEDILRGMIIYYMQLDLKAMKN
ncbi:MAG: hypothetical protein KAQ94_02760 [Arcobacteraceae bacterium]|nr:hypothetical protein [Arcobacteraceae bacterium]